MNKKVLLGTMLTVLILSMFGIGFGKTVEANGTIYIRSDGSIDPPTTPIQCVADVYTFTDDIYNKSIAVQTNNIILDGKGYLLRGPTTSKHMGFGIHLQYRKNVTITNIVISNSHAYSIFLDGAFNCRIINNSILSIDCMWGIRLVDSYHNLLINNTLMNTYKAIELIGSSYNTLTNNKIINNTHGIWLNAQYHPSTGNTLRNNVMTDNKHNFLVNSHFHFMSGYINDVDTSNTVDGKPIYYWINRHDESVPLDAGCVVIVNSSRMTVKNLRLRNTGTGVCLAYTENSVIDNVTATTNYGGIDLELSRYNVITRNNLTDNDGPGIFLHRSNHNNLTDNFVQNTNTSGIWLEDCGGGLRGGSPGYNMLVGNTVLYSRTCKPQEFDGAGILVDDSTYCKVIDNNVTNNSFGIVVGATPATNNQISGNSIVMNDVGLLLGACLDNVIYCNNFIDNKLQADTAKGMWKPGHNTLDSGYPSGGNYWSDYNGTDQYSGLDQYQPGADGIGDRAYFINADNQDRYPLMAPISTFDADIWNETPYTVEFVSNSTVSEFQLNKTEKTISFNVTGSGFCRVTIPNIIVQDMWQGNYTVLLNDEPWPFKNWTDQENTCLYFMYQHPTHEVVITPEFPQFLIPPLLILATLMASILRKYPKKRNLASAHST